MPVPELPKDLKAKVEEDMKDTKEDEINAEIRKARHYKVIKIVKRVEPLNPSLQF